MDVRELYEKIDDLMDKDVTLSGWVRNHRKQKEFGFIDFSDGTCFCHVQLVYTNEVEGFDEIPEELQETEEDRAKDKADEEKMEKFNKFYNYVLYGAIAGFVIFFIWKLIDTFFLK